MPVNYPKFDKKIQDQIDLSSIKSSKTRPGIIMSFDKLANTAVVVLDDQYSGSVGNVINHVHCPFTKGIQGVAPTVGSRCLVGFRDNNEMNPYIINFYDDTESKVNYYHNTVAVTGIPRFMVH